MDVMEAKVAGCTLSKGMSSEIVWVVKIKDEHYLTTNEQDSKGAITFFKFGCEKGIGYTPPVTRDSPQQGKKKKRTAKELIKGLVDDEEVVEVKDKVKGKGAKMTWKQLEKEVLSGNFVYTKQGKKIPCTIKAQRAPNKEVSVSVKEIGKKKHISII